MSTRASMTDSPRHAWALRWALLTVLTLLACTPTDSEPPPPEEPRVSEPAPPSLYLELKSLEGTRVPGALASLPSGPPLQTDGQGTVLFERLPPGPQLLRIQATGYAPSLLAFDLAEGVRASARLTLHPHGEPFSFDAGKGATFSKGGVTVTVPPGALLDEQGQPMQGLVDAFLAPLDVEHGGLLAAPGVLEGLPDRDAQPVGLESLGMVALIFEQDGKVIPFARGIGIRGSAPGTVRVGSGHGEPGPRALQSTPQCSRPRVPAWRLDTGTGRWTATGELGRLEESRTTPGTFEYVITLDNPAPFNNLALPFWWCSPAAFPANPLEVPDPPWVETACLEVAVEDEQGRPVPGRMVVAQGVEYTGLSRALTDAGGRVRLEVMRNQHVDLSAGAEATRVFTGTVAGTCDAQSPAQVSASLQVATRVCAPGAARDCAYSGPEETLNVGICRATRQFCDADGTQWSASCLGEVRPQVERCDNGLDDDCNGATDETCATVCQEGATRPCYEGPAGTEGVGRCRAGTQTCTDAGTRWSACTGMLTPQAEDCASALDDDCDGQVNESSSCDWAATGSVSVPRRIHTATLLGDGTVLVTGGDSTPNAGAATQTTEVYDPVTRLWSLAGAMGSPRLAHTATRLGNGRVLVTGGHTGTLPTRDAELYDPLTRTWAPAPPMATPRENHTATLLDDGRVLVAGGLDSTNPLRTAELYDPDTGTWSPTGDMTVARTDHRATLLSNGKVLVTGGTNTGGYLASTELYDPDTGTWSPADSMAANRGRHTATRLNSGRVLVIGGYNGTAALNTSELYNPGTDTWSPASPVPTVRLYFTATLLGSGQVLVTGGANTSVIGLSSAHLYDPDTGAWSPAGTMTSTRYVHTATLLSNGQVLISAGGASNSSITGTAELYTPLVPRIIIE